MPRPRAFLPLVLAIAAVSTSAPFIRWAAPAPALTVAALRVVIAAAVLWAIGGRRAPAAWRALSARDRAWVVVAGLLFGLHLGVWIASLYFTSTAASVAIVATNPVFSALFGLLLGDRVRRREWQGIAVAALGCAIIGGRDWSAGGGALVGDGLALAGAMTAAGYLVVGRRLRAAMPLVPYLALVNTVAAAGLLIVVAAAGAPLAGLPTALLRRDRVLRADPVDRRPHPAQRRGPAHPDPPGDPVDPGRAGRRVADHLGVVRRAAAAQRRPRRRDHPGRDRARLRRPAPVPRRGAPRLIV